MANTNILNNTPFGDPTLKSTVTSLEWATPEVTYFPATAAVTNPVVDPVILAAYEILYPADRPMEIKGEFWISLQNNLGAPADQEFDITLYDVEGTALYQRLATLDFDSTFADATKVKVSFLYRSEDLANANGYLEYSVYSTETAGDVAGTVPVTVASVNPFPRTAQLRVTAETGTATTIVSLLSGKITLDRQPWN